MSRSSSNARSHKIIQDATGNVPTHELTSYLNELIKKLGIPVTVEAPCELTPSLLLAILECVTRRRLPIPQAVRRARDMQAKIQVMKIFLGVLESDVLQEDVGLSEVDPRRLAAGEWGEVVFVGEILCWLGKTNGFIPYANVPPPVARESVVYEESADYPSSSWHEYSRVRAQGQRQRKALTPSTHSSNTTRDSLDSSLSMMQAGPAAQSDTTVLSEPPDTDIERDTEQDLQTPSLSALDLFDAPSRIGVYRTSTPPPPDAAHNDHEDSDEGSLYTRQNASASQFWDPAPQDVDDSVSSEEEHTTEVTADASSLCHCPSDAEPESPLARYTARRAQPAGVRRSGWMQRVDDEQEMRSYVAAREARTPTANSTPRAQTPAFAAAAASKTPFARPVGRVVTRHTSPTQYTLALLNERAKLMEELASMKAASRPDCASRVRHAEH